MLGRWLSDAKMVDPSFTAAFHLVVPRFGRGLHKALWE